MAEQADRIVPPNTGADISRTPSNSQCSNGRGDGVGYRVAVTRPIESAASDMPSAQGKVKVLHPLDRGIRATDIERNMPSLPNRVNVKNLTKT